MGCQQRKTVTKKVSSLSGLEKKKQISREKYLTGGVVARSLTSLRPRENSP